MVLLSAELASNLDSWWEWSRGWLIRKLWKWGSYVEQWVGLLLNAHGQNTDFGLPAQKKDPNFTQWCQKGGWLGLLEKLLQRGRDFTFPEAHRWQPYASAGAKNGISYNLIWLSSGWLGVDCINFSGSADHIGDTWVPKGHNLTSSDPSGTLSQWLKAQTPTDDFQILSC